MRNDKIWSVIYCPQSLFPSAKYRYSTDGSLFNSHFHTIIIHKVMSPSSSLVSFYHEKHVKLTLGISEIQLHTSMVDLT